MKMIYGKTTNLAIRGLRFSGRIARKIRKGDYSSFHESCTSLSIDNWNQAAHPDVYHSSIASDLVYQELLAKKPSMICRFGVIELSTVISAITPLTICNAYKLAIGGGDITDIGINDGLVKALCYNAGFFPQESHQVERFVELTLNDIKYIDILASWCVQERLLKKELSSATKIRFRDLEPYMHENPWSRVLAEKKVLVIHPFAQTIREQYKKRELLFANPLVLPDFDLITLKAVQSIAGNKTEYTSWFDALEHMKDQVTNIDFDIAIIGCGAYGMPLAAHIKRIGKKAVHLGGQTQLLFGIKGKRWETDHDRIKSMFNEHWVYPSEHDKPRNFSTVEGGAYW